MSEFLKLCKERYSVRSFTDRKVEPEKLNLILEAGRVAPTAVNFQPQVIYVIQSPEAVSKMASVTPYMFGAPQALLVCSMTTRVCSFIIQRQSFLQQKTSCALSVQTKLTQDSKQKLLTLHSFFTQSMVVVTTLL